MARDYAKKKATRKKGGASRGKKQQKKPVVLIFTTTLLVGSFIALLVYLKWYQPISTSAKTSNNIKAKQTAKKISPKQNAEKKNKASDDEVPFYRTHQEMMNKTVEIPIEDLKLEEDDHLFSYSMPCGSFREKVRAEELKAQIAFVGFESKILPVKSNSELWHRVTLGPFTSKRKAESIRHRLQENDFINCKIWRKQIK